MRHQTQETRAERGRRLLNEIDGAAGEAVIAGLQDIAPDFAELLFEFPFGDIYARDALSLRDREIATVAALSAMGTAPKQLGVHVHGALNVGVTGEEVVEVMMQMAVYAGFPAALNALAVAKDVIAERDA
jgi:4-carboxymuconolactone decarboxylase